MADDSVQNVLQGVLKSEDEARAIVSEAEKEAAEIIRSGSEETRLAAARIRKEAQEKAQTMLKDAIWNAEKARDERISNSMSEHAAWIKERKRFISKAAELIAREISGG